MSNTILVVGYGQGIGEHLFRELCNFDHRIAVSRSHFIDGDYTQHISCSVNDFGNHLDSIKDKLSLVVYVPSEFGESQKVSLDEYDAFMNTGPRGLLSVFQSLVESDRLLENALFVSIGSIASEGANKPSNSNPLYAIAKSSQKSLIAQLSGSYKTYRFATVTLGGIKDGDKGVGYENISKAIKFLYQMDFGVRYTEIELNSEIDI